MSTIRPSTGPAAERDWSAAPYVFVVVPTCPTCDCTKYKRVRTENQGDGSYMRKVVCRKCGAPYKIVMELPGSGNNAGTDL